MTLKKLSMVTLLLLAIQCSYSQNLTRNDVSKVKVRSTGIIEQSGEVKGYYFFYNLEKKQKGISNYLLSVVDENLQEVNSITIARSNTYELIESSYNGSAFVFLFFDARAKIVELLSYDNSLKQLGSKLEPIKGRSGFEVYRAIGLGGAAEQRFLVPVANKGFINYSMSGSDKENFVINFLSNDMKVNWSQSSSQKKMLESASEGFQSSKYYGSIIFKTKSQSSKSFSYALLVNDINSGAQQYQVDLSTELFTITPNDVSYDSITNQVTVFGEYFEKGDKQLKKQSQGFCYLSYDQGGKLIFSKTISWADISQQAPVNSSGKFDGVNTNVLFHEFVRTADGKIFAIGEQYKKAVSGAGVALQIFSIAASAAAGGGYIGSSNASSVQMNVYNMVAFQFTPDFTLEKVHIFEKNKNEILLPAGSTYMSTKLLSYYVKAIGGFDYSYTQKLPDDAFTFVYLDADRKTAKGIIGAVVYTPEKVFTVDKVTINKKSTDFTIIRGKAGYFLIVEYFKKEKKLDFRLEKFNY